MMEYVLQVVILAIIFLCIFLEHMKHKELKLLFNQEGDLVKENLNYIASAIIGLSELLEEADEVINQVAQVPSMGDMMQQMIQGFILSKISPSLPKIPDDLITPELITHDHGTETSESENTKTKKI